MLRERDIVNSDTTDHVDEQSLPAFAGHRGECGRYAIQRPQLAGTSIRPQRLSRADRPRPPLTEQFMLHQPRPIHALTGAGTLPNNAPSILSYARPVDRYFTVACFVCLL
ncbi:hypothetical protein HOY80DRAFT_1025104, partial [Tuber brumale]